MCRCANLRAFRRLFSPKQHKRDEKRRIVRNAFFARRPLHRSGPPRPAPAPGNDPAAPRPAPAPGSDPAAPWPAPVPGSATPCTCTSSAPGSVGVALHHAAPMRSRSPRHHTAAARSWMQHLRCCPYRGARAALASSTQCAATPCVLPRALSARTGSRVGTARVARAPCGVGDPKI